MIALSSQGRHSHLRGAEHDEIHHVTVRLLSRGHVVGDRERLIQLADIDEQIEVAGQRKSSIADGAPSPREVDPGATDLEAGSRALETPELHAQIVVETSQLVPIPGLGSDGDRLAQVS